MRAKWRAARGQTVMHRHGGGGHRNIMVHMRRFPALLAILLSVSLLPAAAQGPVRVAAAADLEPVLPHILDEFRQTTGIEAVATYQASAALTTQIQNGAPFDVFLSADLDYPKRLIASGLAQGLGDGDTGTPITYAKGTLVLWTRRDAHLPPPSLELLHNPALKRLAIANPERAPYGKAAVAALQKLGIYNQVKPHLVTAENIAQTAQFVESGNADAGLISKTSAITPRLASEGSYFVIPDDLYPPIEQGAVLLAKAPQRVAAKKLLVFLMSAPVQEELRKFGLTPGRPVPDTQ
jgi:molybdate transport system substrate-binding protein